jgi:hypothetical protein
MVQNSVLFSPFGVSDHFRKDFIGNTLVENMVEEKNEGKKSHPKTKKL